jgi:hypothetical protein
MILEHVPPLLADAVAWFLFKTPFIGRPGEETSPRGVREPRGRAYEKYRELRRQIGDPTHARSAELCELAERSRRLFHEGELSLVEFERRIEVLLDPDTAELRRILNSFYNIGERTSFEIAHHFESERAIATATLEELKAVPNVGRERALAISELVEETWFKSRTAAD